MKKLLVPLGSFILFFSYTLPAYAERSRLWASNCGAITRGGESVTIRCVPVLFTNFVYWLVMLAGVVALFIIIFGGYQLLTSAGDPGKVDAAKKTITFAIVGLVLVFLSFFIVNVIAQLTGVECTLDIRNGLQFSWCSG